METKYTAQIFGPGFNPFTGGSAQGPTRHAPAQSEMDPPPPELRELSLEEAVTALVETAHHSSKQGQIDALGRRGIVLAKR